MMKKLEICIKYCVEATKELVAGYAPDLIIYAAGALPVRPKSIPGIHMAHVVAATDVLQNKVPVGKEVTIIGAGLVGCETAVVLAEKGKKVTLVEMADHVLPEPVFIQNAMMLNQLLDHINIKTKTSSKLMEIKEDHVLVQSNGQEEELSCDTVVLAMGFVPNTDLYEVLKDKYTVVNIGDSVKVRKVLDAVSEAYDAILNI